MVSRYVAALSGAGDLPHKIVFFFSEPGVEKGREYRFFFATGRQKKPKRQGTGQLVQPICGGGQLDTAEGEKGTVAATARAAPDDDSSLMASPGDHPNDWRMAVDSEGRTCFVHKQTGQHFRSPAKHWPRKTLPPAPVSTPRRWTRPTSKTVTPVTAVSSSRSASPNRIAHVRQRAATLARHRGSCRPHGNDRTKLTHQGVSAGASPKDDARAGIFANADNGGKTEYGSSIDVCTPPRAKAACVSTPPISPAMSRSVAELPKPAPMCSTAPPRIDASPDLAGWVRAFTSDGRVYFYHIATRQTRWATAADADVSLNSPEKQGRVPAEVPAATEPSTEMEAELEDEEHLEKGDENLAVDMTHTDCCFCGRSVARCMLSAHLLRCKKLRAVRSRREVAHSSAAPSPGRSSQWRQMHALTSALTHGDASELRSYRSAK